MILRFLRCSISNILLPAALVRRRSTRSSRHLFDHVITQLSDTAILSCRQPQQVVGAADDGGESVAVLLCHPFVLRGRGVASLRVSPDEGLDVRLAGETGSDEGIAAAESV